jgi:hypothetical protein
MTERTSFYHKLGYLLAILVLAIPIVWLSRPAHISSESDELTGRKRLTGGGKLAQLREKYNLAQVNLGEVDPASETIKLATLGLRGVAVNVLWSEANKAKMKEDWTGLTAILEQLAKLQPNFITFWKFQAWNLTYNVSVEFDDYNDRYYYVIRGIKFLREGADFNIDNPQLLWDLGWFIGQKIGRADEYVQYRRLFKADDEFHKDAPERTMEDRDNWLVGKEWYLKAIEAVDFRNKSLGRKSPRDFYSSPAKSQMNYAEAVEEDGAFEKAKRAWQKAGEEWRKFGNVPIEHSTGVKMLLGSQKILEKDLADRRAKLDAMQPDARKKLLAEKRQALKPDERQLLDLPREKLKPEQAQQRAMLDYKVTVTDREVAQRIARDQPAKANQALQMASDIERQDILLQYTINYKHDANFDYWQNRADFEQTSDAIDARRYMFEAKKALHLADVQTSRQLYEKGFAKWRAVIDAFPAVVDEEQTLGGDILDFIKAYKRVLDQFEDHIGENFPLWDVIEKFDREQNFTEERNEHHKHQTSPAASAPATPPAPAPAPAPVKPKASSKTNSPKASTPKSLPSAEADSTKK